MINEISVDRYQRKQRLTAIRSTFPFRRFPVIREQIDGETFFFSLRLDSRRTLNSDIHCLTRGNGEGCEIFDCFRYYFSRVSVEFTFLMETGIYE